MAALRTTSCVLRQIVSPHDAGDDPPYFAVLGQFDIGELRTAGACEAELLISALEAWRHDRTVILPNAEIERRLRTL